MSASTSKPGGTTDSSPGIINLGKVLSGNVPPAAHPMTGLPTVVHIPNLVRKLRSKA